MFRVCSWEFWFSQHVIHYLGYFQTLHRGWESFPMRRERWSGPTATPRTGAQPRLQMTLELPLYITDKKIHILLLLQDLSESLHRWQGGKECRRHKRCGFNPWARNGNPLSSILAWKILWTEKPDRLQSMGSQSQTRLSDWACARTHTHTLQCSINIKFIALNYLQQCNETHR